MNTFPSDAGPYGAGGAVQVYVDKGCKIPAAIFTLTGSPIPGGVAPVHGDGRIDPFQSTATVLYVRGGTGLAVSLYPNPGKTAPTITGSKGANAALTSLLSALAAEGIVIDTTT